MMTIDYEKIIEEMSSLSRTIYDFSDRYKLHIERGTALLKSKLAENIYSFYMVDYDLSQSRILTQAIPIFIKDESAIETWLTAFFLRKKLNLGSFAELFFSKMTKFPNIEFKLGDSANIDIVTENYQIVITINKNEINKIKFPSLFNSNEITNLIKQKESIKYVNYEAIDEVAKNKCTSENKSEISLDKFLCGYAQSLEKITDTQFRENLNDIIKIALVLFVGNSKVSSFIIIPATTWEEGGRKESSGGFIILFTNDNKISLIQEHILTTIANSWFRQNTTNDLMERVKKEGEKRIKEVNNLNRLLSDFQHTILQSIMDSAKEFSSELDGKFKDNLKGIHTYISRRGGYLDELATYIRTGTRRITISCREYNKDELFKEFQKIGLFIKKVEGNNTSEKIEKWRNLFSIENYPNNSIAIEGICWGPIQTVIENLISNSLNKGFKSNKENNKIYIRFCKLEQNNSINAYPAIIYWDTGKGFGEINKYDKKQGSSLSYENILRWYNEGPTFIEEETGYGYWLIGRVMEHVGGELKLLLYDKNNTSKKLNNNLDADDLIIEIFNKILACFI